MKRLLIIHMVLQCGLISAQISDSVGYRILQKGGFGNDSLPHVTLKEINVESRVFSSSFEEARIAKIKAKVIKVYPYAIMAREVLNNIDSVLANTDKRRQIRRFRKSEEKELRDAFENELKGLKVSEGKILVKLINRYTGNSCLRLIRELKGPMYAFVWKKVAKHYGYDLKEKYRPENEPDLEYIIGTLESTFGTIEGD